MSVNIYTIPCLQDNYAYILHDKSSKKTTLVDAPEFDPILSFLNDRDWKLDNILITHHHWDHIAAVEELVTEFNPVVFGAKADIDRLPKLDVVLEDKDKFSVSNVIIKCLEVPGHTIGHLAFYSPTMKILFSGDSLMALGCGRLFEGSAEDMLSSLDKICKLPDDTMIYSGHEYANQNAKFALSIEPQNLKLRNRANQISKNNDKSYPNVPVILSTEKETNPFLRSDKLEIKRLPLFSDKTRLEIFTALRQMKDNF